MGRSYRVAISASSDGNGYASVYYGNGGTEATNDDEEEELKVMLTRLTEWWSAAPSRLVPRLPVFKGSIDVGQQADLCAWDASYTGKPSQHSTEHHRWKGGGVFADMDLRGRVIGTWLKGIKVYDGESDSFIMDEEEKGA